MSDIEPENNPPGPEHRESVPAGSAKTRFEVWGEELIHKKVNPSASSGRVYLPPGWVGCRVKIIRVD